MQLPEHLDEVQLHREVQVFNSSLNPFFMDLQSLHFLCLRGHGGSPRALTSERGLAKQKWFPSSLLMDFDSLLKNLDSALQNNKQGLSWLSLSNQPLAS
jgi:hypothetical protein